MSSALEFHGAVHQNLYLAEGGHEVHAVITVDARAPIRNDSAPTSLGPAAAEVLILDCSGSMGHPPEKIVKAREAAGAAIDELRDGVLFALVAGSSGARMLWPAGPALVPANARTRAEAKTALRRLRVGGGTTIGAWLRLAGQLLGGEHPAAIRHAILLTDGRNEHESPDQLAAAVADCAGLFTCDCRGVGTDWSVAELRIIASSLLGTVGLVAEPAGLAADFRAMMATSMRRAVSDVGLRLWTPAGASVRFIKQVAPTIEDLTARRAEADPWTGDYPTGSWGTESRDYHLCVEIEAGDVGEEKLACRATFVQPSADGTRQPLEQRFTHTEPDGATKVFPSARVRALWTGNLALVTEVNKKVAVVTGRTELAQAVRDALGAHRHGNADSAIDSFHHARKLAEECHDDNLLSRLDQFHDPGTGTVRLDRIGSREEKELDIESSKTTPLYRG